MTLDLGLAARVVSGIRTETARRTGCKEWDAPGIAKALQSTEGPPGAVLAAACIAAEDPTLDKPSAAAFKARWHTKAAETPRVSHNTPCAFHPGHTLPCRECKTGTRAPTADELAALRAVAAQARKHAKDRHQTAIERAAK